MSDLMQNEARRARMAWTDARDRELRHRLFGKADWNRLERNSLGKPKASFQLDINYNRTASITCFDFLMELNKIFSRTILPVRLSNGCINVIAEFEDPFDFEGIDFRDRVFADDEYQDILSAYAVIAVSFYGFPENSKFPTGRIHINELGKPVLPN